ncbi:uncharacterized protein TrAFT101_001054 [Trichoderma asperellum]|uniref:uncharacterized protein n=1 Tax=Trichoderma asperellum TaxID=101201 RepID=UPI00331C13DC|nr:hypothetical protein TrAFT101_001054 [Trichoderma asperellum]
MHVGAEQAAHGVTNTPHQYRGMVAKLAARTTQSWCGVVNPRLGLLRTSLWLCHPFVTLFSFLSSPLNLCFLSAREFKGIEKKNPVVSFICLPCDHLQRIYRVAAAGWLTGISVPSQQLPSGSVSVA